MKRNQFLAALSAVTTVITLAQVANAQTTVIYDSISSASGITRTLQGRPVAAGRTFTGMPFNNSVTDLGTRITGVDFYLSATNASLTTYQSIRINVQFWNEFGADLAPNYFRTPAGTVQTQDFATAGSLPSNISSVASGGTAGDTFDLYLVSLNFAQPVVLSDNGLNGVAFNIQGNTGNGFVSTVNLSTFRTRGNGFVAGSDAIAPAGQGGYLANQSGRTDFNFNNPSTDLLRPTPTDQNEALGIRLRGAATVPEAGTIALFALGAGVPLAGVVVRRRRK